MGTGTRKPLVMIIFVILAVAGVSTAYALINIQLAGDVTVDGTLDVGSTISSPTITDLQSQISALPPGGAPPPTNLDVDFLDGVDSDGFAKSLQSCSAGQLVVGFDDTGNEICNKLRIVPDFTTPISSRGSSGGESMTIGNDGFPIVSYVASSALYVIHCKNTICSDTEGDIGEGSEVVTGNVGSGGTSIVIGNDGLPIIAYVDFSVKDLMVLHCTDVSCNNSDTPVIVDPAAENNKLAMTVGSDGFPIIVYTAAFDSFGLEVAHCSNVTCDPAVSAAIVTPLDSGVEVNDAKKIAIGSDGLPIIAYFDSTNEDLKVIHCTNVSCSTSDLPTTLDSGGVGTTSVSIAIGSDGFPIISYQEGTLGNLQVIHCTNVSCSSFDSPVLIDDGGENEFGSQFVGESSSIIIENDGFPLIAYGAETNEGFLRLVKCKSVDCSTFEAPEYLTQDVDSSQPIILAIGSDGIPVMAHRSASIDIQFTRVGGIGFS